MSDFVASNGFRIREEEDGGLTIDNLYIGPEHLLALGEAVLAEEGATEVEGPVSYYFVAKLEELDEDAAIFSWENFEPKEDNLAIYVPRSIWENMDRTGILNVYIHGESKTLRSQLIFTEDAS